MQVLISLSPPERDQRGRRIDGQRTRFTQTHRTPVPYPMKSRPPPPPTSLPYSHTHNYYPLPHLHVHSSPSTLTMHPIPHPPTLTLHPSTLHPPPYLSGNQWSCVSVSTHGRLVLDLIVMVTRTMLRSTTTNLDRRRRLFFSTLKYLPS